MGNENRRTKNINFCNKREVQNAVYATGRVDGALFFLLFYLTERNRKEMENKSV